MCGINGFTSSDPELVHHMNRATHHRGPDGTGVFSDGYVTLGQNLLAITEKPANSAQPVVTDDFVLVYNGEIYNYRRLRDELQVAGDRFMTDSDTEVLFAGLARYGGAFLERLDGMFAIAWYDRRQKTILLVRDAGGMKPLYYHGANGAFVFSSEIRGLLSYGVPAQLEHRVVGIFFALGYVPGEPTLFAGIRKVCPGQTVLVSVPDGTVTKRWFVRSATVVPTIVPNHEVIRETIGKSVIAHTMGLRPFGLYLSGGLDSTIILHEIAQRTAGRVRTYTTRFDVADQSFNEDADLANRLCSDYDIEHHELLVTEQDFIDAIPHAIRTIEEPRWNFSIPAYWLLARQAAKDIVVVLSGNGGDELFLGYGHYFGLRRMDARYAAHHRWLMHLYYTLKLARYGRLWSPAIFNLQRPLDRWAYTRYFDAPALRRYRVDAARVRAYLASIGHPEITHPMPDLENATAGYDRLFWLADEEYLRTDKIGMHFGMEGRFPFMGHEVVALANGTPGSAKLRAEGPKYLLRQAYRGHLPDYIVDKGKTGWRAPASVWMKSKLGGAVRDVLSPSYYSETNDLFDFDHIHKRYLAPDAKFSQLTMKSFIPIFSFQVWAREFGVRL